MRRWWLGVAMAALGACDDGSSVGGGGAPPPDEKPAAGTLRLEEREIAARPDGARTHVDLVLHRTGGVTIEGRAKVEVLRLSDGAVVATGDAPFTADAAANPVTIPVDFQPDAATPGGRADYVLLYRVEWDDDALWGRRSLFTAQPPSEAQLVGPDHFRTGAASFLRVIARDPRTGRALPDVPVSLSLEREDAEPVALPGGVTDAIGQAALPVQFDDAQVGDARLVVRLEAPDGPQEIRANVAVERATKVLLTTDKPLYQPGQTIHLRALALRRPALTPDADQPLVFEVYDGKGNTLDRQTIETDGHGIAATTFRIAGEVNTGAWRLVAKIGDITTEKTVTVDRYALPKYDVDVNLDQEVYLAGSQLEGSIALRYFFGEPVRGGHVTVVGATLDTGRTPFAEVQGATNDDGLFRFTMRLPDYVVGLPLEQGGGLVELGITATDTAGQERQVARTLRIAKAALEVAVVPESGEIAPGLVNELLVRSLDATGRPVAARHELSILDGGGNALPAKEFETDRDGLARVAIPVAGERLQLRVVSTDADGHRVENAFEFFAGVGRAEGAVLVRPERALYRVGETLNVDVLVDGAPDRVYLDVVRAGQTVLTSILTPDAQGRARYALDLAADHAGALEIDAYYLAQGSSLRRDRASVYVEPADALRIAVRTDRPQYAPGEEARLTFEVTDGQGQGSAAALGLNIVDEAVFGLMEFRPGLEKAYFQIESELAQPRYQIGVPDLATLASDPAAADDPVRQAEAKLLFAAGGLPPAGLSINTFALAQSEAQALVKPAVQRLATAFVEALRGEVSAGRVDAAGLGDLVASGFASSYDPWGKPIEARLMGDQLVVTSLGPDEAAGTPDDIRFEFPLYLVLYGEQVDRDFDDDGANGPFPAPPEAGGGGGAGGGPAGNGGGAPRVRRNFPETLFVEPALITDGQGRAEITVPLADSITTWRLSAMANSAEGLLGSTDAGVRVFQDFFVDLDVPATLTRGDEYGVPVALYNYADAPQTVRLQVQAGDWYELLGPVEQEVDLGPGEVRGVRLPIRVQRVGLHELTVFAIGDRLQDAVARAVRVEPDGQKVETATTGRLEGNISRAVTLPADAVEGSGRLIVKLYPGLFATVVEGLDGLLSMPSGCFEQTSATTWPNVLVTKYMRESGTVTPEIDVRASEFINTGYQRLLTFEVQGGGFEWFGSPPAHVVLTAYGLLEFTDMATVRTVDAAMIDRTRAWLLAQQKADGHWEIAQRGLDETGNLTDPVAVTAYVAFALAAAGERGEPLDRARGYLEARLEGMGTYTLALFANFMAAYQPNGPLTGRIIAELARRVSETVEGDLSRWETDEQTTTYGGGEYAWIETTALATHALLVVGAHPDVAQAALNWLVSKKSPGGNWGSTAGTVWTIKCMLRALSGGRDERADATITVRFDGQQQASFRVTPDNADVMRQADLSALLVPGQEHLVEIAIEGQGNLQYGIVEGHHQPWAEAPPAEGPLSITVEYDRTQLAVDDTVMATVTIANNDLAFADMVMVDLGIPPGFDLMTADLDALRDAGVFRRHEHTERQLLLYFDVVRPERPLTFQYRLVARDPIRAQAPRSRIYSYYNADVGADAEPIEFEVQ